ncbi:uncharacterized protein N7482_005942 [Penicillium canariense]|uniref:Chromosome segregation protein BIR1 n=1 Tax=Penicillium canariense TaxID=189055 RepID=A0A9W9I4W0_9EURO|nr:uncharacterized protein N7482_005942 [Penicillium canariense]KAJ5167161.1 hypothetical protein N7482_005942 [Penicillium canariense]
MGSEMDTFAARLASFDAVLKPEKRRSSTTKGSKVIGWPHHSPSPAELAHAGFYYKPYETNPDNTTCFQCNRALDGWEEEDNPITEHLKHSPDCAWAIIMDIQQRSSNPATIEDPTSERITRARLGTFGALWPHDGKRGWVCQSEKMVEGGWYFCPNEESNDLASCAYCKLSLDGWEPKDDPFDEHYRRSSDCSFFVFAQPPTKKGKVSRTKKSRTSKASSRLSTQSVATVASETPEAPEAPEVHVDEAMDESMMSQATAKPKSTKKGSKGKGKKSKKEDTEVESQTGVDSTEPALPEPPKPKRAGRGKKRASEEMANDDPKPVGQAEPELAVEPPSKRRATRARSSSISQGFNYESQDHAMPDAPSVDEAQEEEPKKARKASKKGAAKSRNASDVSVTSKPASKARVGRDSELDVEPEAGLEADVPEQMEPEPQPEPEKPRASKKTKSSKKLKASGISSEPPQDPADHVDMSEEQREAPAYQPGTVGMEENEEAPVSKTKSSKSSKKKGTKKSKKQESVWEEGPEPQAPLGNKSVADDVAEPEWNESERHESFVSVEIIHREPEPRPEPEAEQPIEKPAKKKSSKQEDKPKKLKKTKKVSASPPPPTPRPMEEQLVFESPPRDEEEYGTPDDLLDQIEMVPPPQAPPPEAHQTHERTPVPPKTTKRFSDIPQEEHLAQSFTESHSSRGNERRRSQRASHTSDRDVSPLPAAHQSTPSLSPQSSDAENRPPSSRPSTSRPTVVASPPPEKTIQTPLAARTPSPSKRNLNAGFPASRHPWTPVDIDEVLFGEASDKENADIAGLLNRAKPGLTSPEKKMTVEEWIMWNAKNGEERLKRECERLVSQFEKEGGRAMRRLEAIECID